MVFHWSLNDSKSPQVSGTLLSILAIFNNAVVWTVSTRPLISKSSNPCTNPFVTEPSAPTTLGITVTLMFYIFFQFSNKFQVLISLFAFFQSLWSAGTAKSATRQVLSYWLSLGLDVWSRLNDPFVSKNPRESCTSHFLGWILGCVYTICSYGQIKTSCTVLRRPPCLSRRV